MSEVDMGMMDVCYYDDDSTALEVLKFTKLYILGMFISMHTNYTAQLNFNRNWFHIKI